MSIARYANLTALLCLFGSAWVVQSSHANIHKRGVPLRIKHYKSFQPTSNKPTSLSLRVLSFNVAHGSNNLFGIVPMFTSAKTIKSRLKNIASFLKKANADVVGLQEADGPSWWSGRFHHVNFLARHAGYPFAGLGIHVATKSKQYGTALLSKRRLYQAMSYRFQPLTMFKKGFVLGSIRWPGSKNRKVDVVSLHLEPRTDTVQIAQIKELIVILRKRNRPVIVMGDFNTVWNNGISPLNLLTEKLKLRTYQQSNPHLYTHTFPRKRRIDWIYISPQLRFLRHKVIQKKLTDHYPVMADIAYPRPRPRPRPKARPKAKAKAKAKARPASLKQYTYWISLPDRLKPKPKDRPGSKPTQR